MRLTMTQGLVMGLLATGCSGELPPGGGGEGGSDWGDGQGWGGDGDGDGEAGGQGGDEGFWGAEGGDGGQGGSAGDEGEWDDNAGGNPDGGGGTVDVNLGQGGAQDFGSFRQVLEAGELPSPDTLDDVGFFNEHHVPLPAPDCGDPICVHGLLAVMGNMINGAGCTMLQLGMNARVPESALQSRDLNLVVAVDVSGSMAGSGRLAFVQAGLHKLVTQLGEGDRVTLVAWSDLPVVVVEGVEGPDFGRFSDAISRLSANGSTNLYAGLEPALEMGRRYYEPARDNRVIFLTDGEPTIGVLDPAEILAMARTELQEGMGLTTIGVGLGAEVGLLRNLSEIGAGNFFFVEDEAAAEEIFTEEIHTFVTPIATDIRLEVQTGGAYELREVMGTRQWETKGDSGSIDIDSLFIAHRQSDEDQELGRRGGGGAILAELMPVRGWQSLDGVDPNVIAKLTLSYLAHGEVLRRTTEMTVQYPHLPDELLAGGYFNAAGDGSAESAEKAFVALNLFVGFRMAAQSVQAGQLRLALIGLEALETGVADWLSVTHDEDIEDDLALLRLFVRNLLRAGAGEDPSPPPPPPDPWPRD